MIYAPVAGKREADQTKWFVIARERTRRRFLVKAHKFVMAHFHFPKNPFTQNKADGENESEFLVSFNADSLAPYPGSKT